MQRLSWLLILVPFVLGCASTTSQSPASPGSAAYSPTGCPADVTEGISQAVSCGYVTVAQDRARPAAGSVDLFVTRTRPSQRRPVAPDPIVLIAADLGWSPLYGREVGWRPIDGPAFGLLPDRVNREVINVDLRGVGHSTPLLSCDEVEALRDTLPGASAGDETFLPQLLDAVSACRARLVGLGVDPAAYNIAEMAADIEDVRIALGLDTLNVESIGTSSAVVFEMMRRYPTHLRSAILDSPSPPQVDLFSRAIQGTRNATDRLVDACEADPPCSAAFPDIHGTLEQSFVAANQRPIRVGTGEKTYSIDGATLARLLSDGLGVMGDQSTLPRDIYADTPDSGLFLDEGIRSDPVLSLGYTFSGHDAPNLMYGAFYSVVCHDELPFADHAALTELAGDESWFVDAYVDSPYTDICARWDAGKAADDTHRPVSSNVPTLILVGRFDPDAPLALMQAGLADMPRASVVEVSNWSHNLLANVDCPISIRNAWLEQPTIAPDESCDGEPLRFVTE